MSEPRSRLHLSFLLVLSGMIVAPRAHAADTIPVVDFAQETGMRAPHLSPDGNRLAYVTQVQGKFVAVVRDLAARSERPLIRGEINDFLIQHCWFKTNTRLICHFSGTAFDAGDPYHVSRMVAIDVDGSNAKVLIQNGKAGVSQFQDRVLHSLPDDPEHVLIELDDDDNVFPSVFMLNINNGRLRQVVRAREPVLHWLADRDGVVRFGYGFRATGDKGLYLARDSADADWRVLERFSRFDSEQWDVVGFGASPNTLLVTANHNGRQALFEMDLSDKSDRQLVFANNTNDIDGPVLWPTDDRVVGVEYETDKPQLELFDPLARRIQRAIDGALPGMLNRVIGASRDNRRILLVSASDVRPPRFYIFDLTDSRIAEIGQLNPSLRDRQLATMRSVSVPGPGGISIPGYLTLPVGSTGKNLPGIVMPHGGPYGRDSWGYDDWLQMMVSRGYAILQLNFRGSTGYGQDWLDAGFQAWGTVMHDDITAGAKWLAAEGIADSKRICIVGWSYGGYAALIGAIKEPERYRCAVSIAGVSDLMRWKFQTGRFYGGVAAASNRVGNDDLAAQSPRKRAAEINAPILLVHGTDDVNVKIDHSKQMAQALQRAGKQHELIVIDDGDHSLSKPQMRATLYQALERFLGQHLGAGEP